MPVGRTPPRRASRGSGAGYGKREKRAVVPFTPDDKKPTKRQKAAGGRGGRSGRVGRGGRGGKPGKDDALVNKVCHHAQNVSKNVHWKHLKVSSDERWHITGSSLRHEATTVRQIFPTLTTSPRLVPSHSINKPRTESTASSPRFANNWR